jgi:O-antigen ligase
VEAILGLNAVASHALPDAERLVGAWRPGGTFQYPPALAILEVGVLPVLSRAIELARSPIAGAAACAAVLAGAVLGLAGNRLALGLAAAVLAVLMFHRSASAKARMAAIATAGLVGIGGLMAPVVLGGRVGPTTPGAGAAGAAELALVAAAGGLAWLFVRRRAGATPRRAWLAAGVCIVALALAVIASAIGGGGREQRAATAGPARATQRSDLLHGRGQQWQAAIQTWLDRPGLGAGADAYYVASLPHQRTDQSLFAHDLPLELAAELGVMGLLLGLALYASTAWTIARAVHTSAMWLLAPLAVAFLASNLLDWTWHLAGLGAVWAAAVGTLRPR